MVRAQQGRPIPTPERLATQPLRGVPNIPPDTATPATTGTIDIAALARQGAALTTTPTAGNSTTALRVFITLDMPRGSLQRLVEQAERSGATLVLRGLKAQSMRQTLAAAGELIGNRRVSWVIDPNAFLRFQVSAAPTFVLMLAGEAVPARAAIAAIAAITNVPTIPGLGDKAVLPQCSGIGCTTPASPSEYLSISGDVSLDYALEAMLRRSVDAAPHASAILQRLRKP